MHAPHRLARRAPRLATILPAVCLVALAGCHSDGQVGATGKVRFSQVLDYADTNDFAAPVAVGATLLVALQAPADQSTDTGLTLAVRQGGHDAGAVSPMGFGQFAVVLPSPGTYDLVALDHGTELDHLSMTAEDVHGLRLSQRFGVLTQGPKCTEATSATTGLADFVLHANQRLTVFAVPTDAHGKAMVGLLPLTADGPDAVAFDSPLVGEGIRANALSILPAGTLGQPVTVTVTDPDVPATATLKLGTSADDAPVSCQP